MCTQLRNKQTNCYTSPFYIQHAPKIDNKTKLNTSRSKFLLKEYNSFEFEFEFSFSFNILVSFHFLEVIVVAKNC